MIGLSSSSPGARPEETLTTDKKVYEKLVIVLPQNRSIGFIPHNIFAGSSSDLDRLDNLGAYRTNVRFLICVPEMLSFAYLPGRAGGLSFVG